MLLYNNYHEHLSGSTPLYVLWDSIKESGYKIKAKTYFEFEKDLLMKDRVSSLDSYLETCEVIDKVQSSPQVIEKSVYFTFITAFLNHTKYLELRFNPLKRTLNDSIDMDKIFISARAGMERARVNYGIDGKLIFCMGRECSAKANEAVAIKAIKYFGVGVGGIDIAGPYKNGFTNNQKDLFKEIYSRCKKLGMTLTAHSGETYFDGVEEDLRFVIEDLGVTRIGHGVQIVKFPSLLKLAHEKNIMLEICPTSNLTTGVFTITEDLGKTLKILTSYKINYSINTDSSALLKTTLHNEIQLANFAMTTS